MEGQDQDCTNQQTPRHQTGGGIQGGVLGYSRSQLEEMAEAMRRNSTVTAQVDQSIHMERKKHEDAAHQLNVFHSCLPCNLTHEQAYAVLFVIEGRHLSK